MPLNTALDCGYNIAFQVDILGNGRAPNSFITFEGLLHFDTLSLFNMVQLNELGGVKGHESDPSVPL